jgi:flagellar hook-basal body complex protein FliE
MTAAITQPHVSQALAVYQSVDGGTAAASPAALQAPQDLSDDFSSLLSRALGGAIAAGQQADTQSMQAIAGGGNITSVVAAVSRAQLALQTTVAIRDRVLQAYQDIIKMPI